MTQLGIQTIIFGERTSRDLPGVLADIKAAGYEGVEFGMQDTAPEAIRSLFAHAGLVCCGYHTGYQTFTDLEVARRHAEHLLAVGGKYLMCSGIDSWQKADADAYRRSAEVFNKAGAALSDIGVHLCYHNHNWEFFDLGEGRQGMDILLSETDPALVKLCPDIYWLACGGNDPAEWLRRHGSRCVYFHLKDGAFDASEKKPLTFTELGRGQVDLKSAAAVIKQLAPEWVVTEQDRTDGEPAESARLSAVYAREELGF